MDENTTIQNKALLALKQNKIKLHQVEEFILSGQYQNNPEFLQIATLTAEDIRREFLEEERNIKLPKIAACNMNISNAKISHEYPQDKEMIQKSAAFLKGIENKIGCITIPLGITAPLKINGKFARNSYYIPLATNEAALIAGINRAIKAANLAAGITTAVSYSGMTRSIIIETENIHTTAQFAERVQAPEIVAQLQQTIQNTAQYTKLISYTAYQIANKLWIRFVFDTSEAMGMNSATKYTAILYQQLTQLFPEYRLKLVSLSGNLCVDKKSSSLNLILGRGYAVHAELFLQEKILKQVFNSTAQQLHDLNYWKNYVGSSLAGTISSNANAANSIAALFAATGQDLAQLGEASSCFTTTEVRNSDLYFCITLPCLTIGTVGGGTNRNTAQECLNILQCNQKDGNDTKRLAEIIAATVLCGELNLLATLANKTELADSHMKLARGEEKK